MGSKIWIFERFIGTEQKGFCGGIWEILQFNGSGGRGWVIGVLLEKIRSFTFENCICIY